MSALVLVSGDSPLPIVLWLSLGLGLCALAGGSILFRWLPSLGPRGRVWPAAEGVILDSTVIASREHRQRFRAEVRYRYEVDGQRYEGDRIRWDDPADFGKYTRARKILDRYRCGSVVSVHYDPARPGVSVLQPKPTFRVRPVLVIAPAAAASVLLVVALMAGG